MFTGLVTATGRVRSVDREPDRLVLTVEAPYEDLEIGESIAVDGACLTVVTLGNGWFGVEAVVTTRGRTRFNDLEVGSRVNLERAIAVGERLGGHFVQGHVDGVGTVETVVAVDDVVLVDVAVPEAVAELCVPHGSITVNGVSLTVNALPRPGVVQLSLIPHTVDHTTLNEVSPGDDVHLEADMLGKYVRQLMDARSARA